jgi:hypothetical protein
MSEPLPPPLFILAPPRSFTSVVCGMIGQHPEMYGLPEVNLFVAERYIGLQMLYRRFRPHLAHGLLRAISELGLGGQTVENAEAARAFLEDEPHASTTRLFTDLVEWAAPRRVVDKSPLHVIKAEYLDRMYQAFPDAQFLHLTRHPLSTCKSVMKLSDEIGERGPQAQGGNDGSWRLVDPQSLDTDQIWGAPHRRIVDFLAPLPDQQKLRIRGEDLMGDPKTGLRQIAQWLGVSDADDALEAMLHPERSPFACLGPPNAMLGNDPNYLRNPVLKSFRAPEVSLDDDSEFAFSADAKRLAHELGYD